MKTIHVAHKLASSSYVAKLNKFVVELEIHGLEKAKYWLSEKQHTRLMSDFDGADYSTKRNPVFVCLDDERYVWSSAKNFEWIEKQFFAAPSSEALAWAGYVEKSQAENDESYVIETPPVKIEPIKIEAHSELVQ